MDGLVLGTAAIAFLAAGCVKGVIGLGLPLTSIAILGTVVDIRTAIPLIVIPVLVTNIWQVRRGGHLLDLFRRFWSLNLAFGAGTWVGTVLLFMIDPRLVLVVLGTVVCLYSLLGIAMPELRLQTRREALWSPAVGLFSGLLTGTTGSVGAPIAIYLQALGLEKERFLQGISLSFLLAAIVWFVALADQGAVNRDVVILSTLALIPAFAGMWIGGRIRNRLSQERFRSWVFAFLIVIGANLIRKGLA